MTANFSPQPIGEKEKRDLWIENISDKTVSLKSTLTPFLRMGGISVKKLNPK